MKVTIFIRYLSQIFFRLLIWCLLTSNFKLNNIIIGIIFSTILPKVRLPSIKIRFIFIELIKTIAAFPNAVKESILLILMRKRTETFVYKKSSVPEDGSQFINFLDLFRITLTPLTMVTKREDNNNWRVHVIEEEKR